MKHLIRVIVLLCGLLAHSSNSTKAIGNDHISLNQKPEHVSFCDLVKKSDQYHAKLITTEAIIVYNFQPRLDGGDTFLYNPKCNEDSANIYSDFFAYNQATPISVIDTAVGNTFTEAEKKRTSWRATLLITGKFYRAAEHRGFGHLDWAQFKVETQKIEKASVVLDQTPWPSRWKEVKKR